MLTVIVQVLLTELHGAIGRAVIHPTRALAVLVEHLPDTADTASVHLVIEIALAVLRVDAFDHLAVGAIPHKFRTAGGDAYRDLLAFDHLAVGAIHIPVARFAHLGVLDHLAVPEVVGGPLVLHAACVMLIRRLDACCGARFLGTGGFLRCSRFQFHGRRGVFRPLHVLGVPVRFLLPGSGVRRRGGIGRFRFRGFIAPGVVLRDGGIGVTR